jgi:hypothetical protein
MKNLKNIIRKVLKEQEEPENVSLGSKSSDFYFYKSLTGNLLMIPKSSKPSNITTLNKSFLKSYYNTPEKILELYNNEGVKNTCKTVYKDMEPVECAAIWLQIRFNKLSDGGVTKFEAYNENGERKKYTPCWQWSKSGTATKFEDWTFTGYYSEKGTNGKCTGGLWNVTENLDSKREEKTAGGNVTFSITLLMNK